MKNILKILLVLCAFATPAAFGQVLTWIGPSGGNIGRGTNWSGNNGSGGTTPITGTIGTFDGTVPGNLVVQSIDGINGNSGAPIGGSFGATGFSIDLTPTQTGSVQFISPVPAAVGIGFNAIRVQSGAGQLILGDATANQLVAIFRPAASPHTWINESANPIIIHPNFDIKNGGGAAGHVIVFQGTGDFWITNYLRFSNGSPSENLQWDSTGTTIWTAGGAIDNFDSTLGAIAINAGTVIIKSAGLIPNTPGLNTVAHSGTLLNFDAAAQSDTMVRAISGTGPLQVNNGTWTFTGASTTSGSILLSGGTLIAGGAETVGVSGPLGVGGTISFTGGTLGWNVNNVFDYSARFDTAASQVYNLDTGGQNVTLATGLSSSGGTLTKLNGGTLTLAGVSTYSGLTTISGGKLVFQGAKSGSGSITVADGTALGITDTGAQVTPSTLTVGTSSGATLEFNNVNSIATAPLAPTTLAFAGTVTINVNSGTLAPGQSYPLLAWTSGSAPAVSLGVLNGFVGNLTTNGNSIQLNVTATAYLWTGITDGSWDLTTGNNWQQNGGPVIFDNGAPVLFDDSSATTNVTVNALVQPTTITVNTTNPYSIASSGGNNIGGSAKLTKSGTGSLALSGGANTYSGITTVNGGTLSVGALANGGAASDLGQSANSAANLVLEGGTLQYTGGAASIDRLFTLSTSGGAIESAGSVLAFTNTGALGYIGNGARTLTLTGTNEDNNTLASLLANNGGATAVTKSGPGKWILTANNTHSGVTTIAGGVLQIGAGGANGSPGSGNITANGSLVFNRTGSLTVGGVISGNGAVTNDGNGTVILTANNTYAGGTTINAGTLQVGNGGATGSLNGNGVITNNSLLIFNTTGSFIYSGGGTINGTGNVIVRGNGGVIGAYGANTYTGWTLIDPGATFQPSQGNQGTLVSSVITNNGTLKLVRQDTATFFYSNNIVGTGRLLKDVNNDNANDVTLLGTNTYSGGTIIAGGQVVLGDGGTVGAGSITGNVIFTNSPTSQDVLRALVFNRPDDVTFAGTLSGNGGAAVANAGRVEQRGTGKLTLTGSNTHRGGALVTAGTLLVNGASTGTGTVTVNAGGTLGGTGTIGGNVDVAVGGILAPGTSIGTLTISSNLNLAGDLAIEVNKSLAQSNDLAVVNGVLTNSGTGTLTVANLGPALVVGDKFTLFSKPVQNGAALTITGGGGPGWINNLAVDGSIVVGLPSPTLNVALNGSNLDFSWTESGFKLQAQTNSLSVGISNNWGDYPGGGASPVSVPVDVANGTVFFRLVSTP